MSLSTRCIKALRCANFGSLEQALLFVLLASCAVTLDACAKDLRVADHPALTTNDDELARALSRELSNGCPEAPPGDAEARARCAQHLGDSHVLEGHVRSALLWGAQNREGDLDLGTTQTTRFDWLVFRRLYLSTFMFDGRFVLEHHGEQTIVRVPTHFRYALDPGEYPYPFWHSEPKWRSYQQAQALLFIFEHGELRAVLRSADKDTSREVVSRRCDGCLEWTRDANGAARVRLYRAMFSADNPHVQAVDDAYRAFELAQRKVGCTGCHSPGNPAHMNPLELFSYPNQALGSRHAIVRILEHNHMPPADGAKPAGIGDDAYRRRLVELAQAFATAGDEAIAFEQTRARD